ncbi:Hepatocyte growth factor-regulated tyrosine kinase substrate [Halotydeus destructor]|nr:Hepatocyte growth factor-regulated tyrosine kinase substrate [Halotydeus destructor]
MFSRSTTNFDRILEKATNHLNLEPDWDSILQVCDCIRSGEVPPKYGASAIKKRLYASNPHVNLFALQVLESCAKNCGTPFHVELTSKVFMEDLRDLTKVTTHEKVRDKILELIQIWAHAFRNDPSARTFVQETLNTMKAEGYKFPVLRESDAMFAADIAPQWADADSCHRCRSPFSLVNRKHHCRCCGQIFCGKCSAKLSAIPKFGIEKEVRVCDECFDKLNNKVAGVKQATDSPVKAVDAKATAPPGKTEEELKEEEELQMALALSQSEAEEKKERDRRMRSSSTTAVTTKTVAKTSPKASRQVEEESPIDPELSRYLDRSYWEQKPWANEKRRSDSPAPSAPASQANKIVEDMPVVNNVLAMNGDNNEELEGFLGSLRSALVTFHNRMNSNKARGRPVANDTSVQSLFINITNMHSQLLRYIQEQDDERIHLESLQDKLTQIRDARAALDALREEHQERLRIEAEEADRIRQQQMAYKLDIMRQKKQEYLQYQRQMALQRIQEQEAAMKTMQQTKYYPQAGMYAPGNQNNYYPGMGQPGPHMQGMPPQNPTAPGGPMAGGCIPPGQHSHIPGMPPQNPTAPGGSMAGGCVPPPTSGSGPQPGIPTSQYQPSLPQYQPQNYPAYNMHSVSQALPQVAPPVTSLSQQQYQQHLQNQHQQQMQNQHQQPTNHMPPGHGQPQMHQQQLGPVQHFQQPQHVPVSQHVNGGQYPPPPQQHYAPPSEPEPVKVEPKVEEAPLISFDD